MAIAAKSVSVTVRGVDERGNPFMQTAQAIRISRNTVELAGVECLTGAADVVTLEFNRRRCRYRVAWTGCDKDGRGGHAGLESLDPVSFIFDSETHPQGEVSSSPAPQVPTTKLPATSSISRTQRERRRYQRYSWGANAQVRKKGVAVNTPCKVTDISFGGCYAELMMPFPEGTAIEIELLWQERRLTIDARVAISHPAIGMGVSFFGFSEEQYRMLRELIDSLSGKSPSAPPSQPANTVNPAALAQDLLEWFAHHEILSRSQFEQLVQKQKPKNAPSASPTVSTGTY